RRILYAMNELGLVPGRPYKKSATVVGDVLGKYHPHGDVAVYDSLVRMVQDFSLRYPLVDGQGNFGSVDGDPPAAERYTEARLSRIASSLLEDIDKECVDFRPNYDDSESEPEVLPTRVPNLLINGSEGIAVGMDREAIIVTELPYQVNKAKLIETTAGLVNEKKIEGISEIRDESDREGMRIVYELKRGEQAEIVLNNLFKQTQLQLNFGVIL